MVWYEVNQSYIAQEFCIKKEVVENDCQGTCHLANTLQLTEQKQSDTPVYTFQFEVLNFIVPKQQSFDINEALVLTESNYHGQRLSSPFLDDVFRPPSC